MPRDHRKSRDEFPLSEAQRLRQQGQSLQTIADTIGWSFAQVRRKLQAAVASEPTIIDMSVEVVDLTPPGNSELSGEPGSPDAIPQAIETVHSGSLSGEPPTALQRVEYMGEPSGEPGLPDIARQTDLDNLKMRVEVLETFIAKLHQPAAYLPGSPNGAPGSPTHKRGFVMADDLFQAIHTYATAHHLQVKDVVDLALRRFFAQVGEAVSDA